MLHHLKTLNYERRCEVDLSNFKRSHLDCRWKYKNSELTCSQVLLNKFTNTFKNSQNFE